MLVSKPNVAIPNIRCARIAAMFVFKYSAICPCSARCGINIVRMLSSFVLSPTDKVSANPCQTRALFCRPAEHKRQVVAMYVFLFFRNKKPGHNAWLKVSLTREIFKRELKFSAYQPREVPLEFPPSPMRLTLT